MHVLGGFFDSLHYGTVDCPGSACPALHLPLLDPTANRFRHAEAEAEVSVYRPNPRTTSPMQTAYSLKVSRKESPWRLTGARFVTCSRSSEFV
jgi:hypothetical protein